MIRLAPLWIPIERRLQTLAVLCFVLLGGVCWLSCALMFYFPLTRPFILLYFAWALVFDRSTPANGYGRPFRFLKHLPYFHYFSSYFPGKLIKTEDLDPKKNYIFGYHPHGIIGFGVWANIASECQGWSKKFPGIDMLICTLKMNFQIFPLAREFILGMGFISVSKRSILNKLKRGPGHSVMIVVGGAAEALDAVPGTNDLTLQSRKGFVKLALQTGSNLVPVFCFGENDLFNPVIANPRGSKLRYFQDRMKDLLGFSLPLFIGRGVFNYDFGFLPHRKPLVTVVGRAVEVPKIENPSKEDVEKYHKLYCESLKGIYEDHKTNHARTRKKSMSIL